MKINLMVVALCLAHSAIIIGADNDHKQATRQRAIKIAAYNACPTKTFRSNPKNGIDEWACNCAGRYHQLLPPQKRAHKGRKARDTNSKPPMPVALSLKN